MLLLWRLGRARRRRGYRTASWRIFRLRSVRVFRVLRFLIVFHGCSPFHFFNRNISTWMNTGTIIHMPIAMYTHLDRSSIFLP